MKNFSLVALALVASLALSEVTRASLSFSSAELLGMTVNLGKSTGYNFGNGTGILTPNPTFEDLVSPMAGNAGGNGNLMAGGTAFYSLSAAGLTSFNATISGGGETLVSVGHNDNNQPWNVGIWYETAAGIVTDFVSLVPGTSGALLLAGLPASVLDAGVYVGSALTQPDNYHASWTVPEATSFLIWGGLAMAGATAGRRRRS